LVLAAAGALAQDPPPEQPIPFSHQVHAGASKIRCNTCHPNPDPGESMTIVAAAKCMQCHSAVKTESPAIQKLASYAKDDRAIKWVRVYSIPSYVNFSHKSHLQAGNTCQECHGPVPTREALFKEGDISMGGCMNCHREKKASIDCTYCHEQQQ
jgi:hypothetical protein